MKTKSPCCWLTGLTRDPVWLGRQQRHRLAASALPGTFHSAEGKVQPALPSPIRKVPIRETTFDDDLEFADETIDDEGYAIVVLALGNSPWTNSFLFLALLVTGNPTLLTTADTVGAVPLFVACRQQGTTPLLVIQFLLQHAPLHALCSAKPPLDVCVRVCAGLLLLLLFRQWSRHTGGDASGMDASHGGLLDGCFRGCVSSSLFQEWPM